MGVQPVAVPRPEAPRHAGGGQGVPHKWGRALLPSKLSGSTPSAAGQMTLGTTDPVGRVAEGKERKRMDRQLQFLNHYLFLIVFGVFILGFCVVDILLPNRKFSEMENRFLKQLPAFSVQALVNNEYTLRYEEFVNDQFIGRDTWITLKSICESILFKVENNGVALGQDGYQFEKAPTVDEEILHQNIQYLETFLRNYPGQAKVGIIPNSYQVLWEKVPLGFPGVNQLAYIQNFYQGSKSRMGNRVSYLDLNEVLSLRRDEYIYYHTDHHWTTLGAFYAYQAYAQSRGLQVATMDKLLPYARKVEGFLGTYYSKSKYFGSTKDTITWYNFPVGTVTIDGKTTVPDGTGGEIPVRGMYEDAKWKTRDKYAAFLYGNHGLTILPSQVNLNHQEGKTSRILLIKDSYGNSLAPFLTWSYDEVYIVDLRGMTEKVTDLLKRVAFDDVFILYNFQSFATDRNIVRLTF